MDTNELPNLIIDDVSTLDHSFATALGLLRVGMDTLAGTPEDNSIRAKLSRLLQH